MATSPLCPLHTPPKFPLPLGVGPSHRCTPSLAVERGGEPPEPGTKKPKLSPPAHLSGPWTGSSCSHSPASTRLPGRGGALSLTSPTFPEPPPLSPGKSWLLGQMGAQVDRGLGHSWGDSLPARLRGDRDTGAQRGIELRVGDPKTELGQARRCGWGPVGKVGGRQGGAKPFPFMETIFSKNKQFRCRATRELPAPPTAPPHQGHVRLRAGGGRGGGVAGIEGRVEAREVMGVGGGSKRGCLEASKGRDKQGLSLTCPPQPWRPARALFSPTLHLSLASPFCCLTPSHPAAEVPAHPTTREDPLQAAGAGAVGTWEDGPGGAPAGHEGGAGAPGAAKLLLSHTLLA